MRYEKTIDSEYHLKTGPPGSQMEPAPSRPRGGVETQTVRSWECGTRSPSPESLRRLCKIFVATLEQLGFPPGPAAKSPTQEASATRQAETSTTPQQIG